MENKVDFVVLMAVNMANCNGDPLNGNRPRTNYEGYGEMSDVCIKRKIRNRMQDMGYPIFVQSEDRCEDGYTSLANRANAALSGIKEKDAYSARACELWTDVRAFGQVFAFKSKKDSEKGVSVGIRGPVSIHQAVSISPVEIESMQITKSVNGDEAKNGDRASDTMGFKHFVKFGMYMLKGSISPQLAEKTGFSTDDAAVLKEALRTLFVNDSSSARPEGSMEVIKVIWFDHGCKDGKYSSAKVHRSVHVEPKNPDVIPSSADDYSITVDPLEGLVPEIIDGI